MAAGLPYVVLFFHAPALVEVRVLLGHRWGTMSTSCYAFGAMDGTVGRSRGMESYNSFISALIFSIICA